jgi:hypothetical protein
MPTHADAVTRLPSDNPLADGIDCASDFMAWNTR